MLLDIQGSMYSLYDPEIATALLNDDLDNTGEVYFCAGNLSHLGINKFLLMNMNVTSFVPCSTLLQRQN